MHHISYDQSANVSCIPCYCTQQTSNELGELLKRMDDLKDQLDPFQAAVVQESLRCTQLYPSARQMNRSTKENQVKYVSAAPRLLLC